MSCRGETWFAKRPAATLIDPETMLRLEHIIVAHQRLPEWGAPKPPMTPEALMVHYADDLDAKLHMMVVTIEEDATDGPVTSKRNVLGHQIYRGGLLEPRHGQVFFAAWITRACPAGSRIVFPNSSEG